MKREEPVTRETVERLCVMADLPRSADRREKLVAGFAALIAAANDLNRKIADGSQRGVLPITRFPER